MSLLYRKILLFSAVLLSLQSGAQLIGNAPNGSSLRVKMLRSDTSIVRIDTLSIVPNTFHVRNISRSDYRIDEAKATLYWLKKPLADSFTVEYRVFPFNFYAAKQRFSYDSVMNRFYSKPFVFNNGAFAQQKGAFDFGTIKAEGSLGRQIGFGNSQDAVLNSTLNLQLSGMLGDSIELLAAITDNNIPVQPDGNTQQLNEFDQIYLQFKKKGWQLNLGDIDIRQNQGYFLNFYKRLQGVSFQSENRLSKTVNSKTLVSGSVAKGKFARQILEPQEGNQGPYRLRGPNGEFFFVVLANTERVFYDGELLQRGEDQDYVINYNTAEITFTPKRMITKDSRIQVEFEFAERNYLNANLYLSQELEINKKLKIRLGAFNNGDAKNSQINQTLDDKQKQFLADLGDSTQRAFYPSAYIDTFAADKILYEKIYIGLDSFYQYSTNPLTAKYNLSFVNVQQGNGNYTPDFNGANGKVYKYVAPVAGVKQGSYEPVQILVAPKNQQVVSLGMDYNISKGTVLKAELATSNYDANTFSKKDNGDDRGWAAKLQLNNEKLLRQTKQLMLTSFIDYEVTQQKFRPLERLRSVEFSRDWGLQMNATTATAVDENILKAGVGLKQGSNHTINYQFINYHRSDDYNGFQNGITHTSAWKGWQLSNQFVITNFNGAMDKGIFIRPTVDINRTLKKLDNWRIGFKYAMEQNAAKNKAADTLTPLAFSFDSYSAYLRSDESKKNKYGLTFFTRSDKYPVSKSFIRADRSLNLNLQTSLKGNLHRQLFLNATFRKLQVLDAAVSKQKADETILGRAEYLMNEWKGLLSGNVLYEVGAGQEQRRDFAYLEVPAGQGEYAWIDYNSDGVQQLNEFERAAFPDQAKFIRIFTPTNDFIKANYITFNYRLDINPKAVMKQSGLKGFKKIISRINLLTSFQTNKKSVAKGNFEFNPFKYGVADTALITLSTTILNTFSFNRFNSKWGVDFSNYRSTGKSLLTYGYESRKINDWTMKWRWNIGRSVSLSLNAKKGMNGLYTPQFANRNFELTVYNAEPFVTFIRGTNFRVVTGYKFETKKNKPEYGSEKAVSHSLNVESKYNILQNSSVTGKFTLNSIDFDFPSNTTVGYIMLDGLLPGKNYLWSLTLNKRLLNNLELTLQYDGRKAGTAKTVHVGRAGITALF